MKTETRVPLSRPYLDEREEELVLEVLRSGRLSLGPVIERFEQLLAERVGAPYAAAVSSGTAGLHMLCHIAGVQEEQAQEVMREGKLRGKLNSLFGIGDPGCGIETITGGEIDIGGHLPVSIPGQTKYGDGIQVRARRALPASGPSQ